MPRYSMCELVLTTPDGSIPAHKLPSTQLFVIEHTNTHPMSPSRCINNLGGCVLLRDTTEQAIDEYVREHCTECYEIPPDFEFRDIAVSLNQPMLLGFDTGEKKLLLPCVKRCAGPMLVELDADDDEFEELRTKLGT